MFRRSQQNTHVSYLAIHLRTLAAFWLLGFALTGCGAQTVPLALDLPPNDAQQTVDSITVVDFSAHDRGLGASAAQSIRNGLASEGYIRVLDRGGAAVLTGTVELGQIRTAFETHKHESKDDGTSYTYEFTKKMSGSISYSLKSGGTTLAGNGFPEEYEESWTADSRDEARIRSLSDEQVRSRVLGNLARKVVFAISPHRETRQLRLQDGSHPGLKRGIVYMQNNRIEQAFEIWDQVIDQATTNEDIAAASYNIGVIMEAQQRYTEAFEQFSRADQLVPATSGIANPLVARADSIIGSFVPGGRPNYVEAMTRVENAKQAQDELRRQLGIVDQYRLRVLTSPENARVRIMNIQARYRPGMSLKPGRYDVVVDREGYASERRWVDITDRDVTEKFTLRVQ